MSTSSSGSSSTTNHSGNPTTAKHQLVSPEGFLRPVEVPDGATKLVIYVGGDREKLETILRVCEGINGVRKCMDLCNMDSLVGNLYNKVNHLVFNSRKHYTFTYLPEGAYEDRLLDPKYYEVSYDLFIEKLRWAERALLFQGYMEDLG